MRLRVHLPESTFEWEWSGAKFRVGRGGSCALRFEGESAKFASWEHAEFAQEGDGIAFVTDLASSNGTYLDGSRIARTMPLRVGAVVQIGRAGPRLEVLALATGIVRPAPIPVPVHNAVHARPLKKASASRFVLAGIICLAVIVGFFLASQAASKRERSLADRSTTKVKPPPPNKPEGGGKGGPGRLSGGGGPSPQPSPKPPVLDGGSLPSPVVAPDEPQQQALDSYRLIVVEDPQAQACWPLAGSVVVGERVLLSTASVAIELTKYLERGFNVAVMKPPHGPMIRISERRVHAAFQAADPAEQLFFDAALLYADEPLGDAVKLASAEEFAQLERGQPVICVTVDHAFEVIDRFQELGPQSHEGKIFTVTGLPPQPGPRLLHIRGALSDKSAGSLIVNQLGRLIALYSEPAPSDGAAGTLDLHYAKVIEPALIESALDEPDESIWVPLRNPTNTKETAK